MKSGTVVGVDVIGLFGKEPSERRREMTAETVSGNGHATKGNGMALSVGQGDAVCGPDLSKLVNIDTVDLASDFIGVLSSLARPRL